MDVFWNDPIRHNPLLSCSLAIMKNSNEDIVSNEH